MSGINPSATFSIMQLFVMRLRLLKAASSPTMETSTVFDSMFLPLGHEREAPRATQALELEDFLLELFILLRQSVTGRKGS